MVPFRLPLRPQWLRAVLAERRRGGPEDAGHPPAVAPPQDPAGGILGRASAVLFRTINRPWKMYPLGVIFGLGFDTSSEVAILGIASVHALRGTSIWFILVFPVLFTCKSVCPGPVLPSPRSRGKHVAAMCLVDTLDGASMMALYTSKSFSRDPVALLYYSIILTAITITVSAFIGIIQALSLVQNVAAPRGPFWDGLSAITDHFDLFGGSICGLFVIVGLSSVVVYRPWRKRIDRRRRQGLTTAEESGLDNGQESPLQQAHHAVT